MKQKARYIIPATVISGLFAISVFSKRSVYIEQVDDRLYYVIKCPFKLPAQIGLNLYVNGELVWTDWLPYYSKVGFFSSPAEWFWSVPSGDERYLLSRYVKSGDELQVEIFQRNVMVKPPFVEPPPPEEDLGAFYFKSNKIIWY
jgi:hypothetical protein